jgi:hypothetical protein
MDVLRYYRVNRPYSSLQTGSGIHLLHEYDLGQLA